MSILEIRRAEPGDAQSVVDILNEAADQLASRGISQWRPGWMNMGRITPMIHRGETFVAHDHHGILVATVSLSADPDPDFWTPDERQASALYMSKLASRKSGAGAQVLKWVITQARDLGYEAVRLDAWATNYGLHNYYRRRGWRHLRTMNVPGRDSGALFEHSTTTTDMRPA